MILDNQRSLLAWLEVRPLQGIIEFAASFGSRFRKILVFGLMGLCLTILCPSAHTLDEAVMEFVSERPTVIVTWLRLPHPQLAQFDQNNDGRLDETEIQAGEAILAEFKGHIEVLGDGTPATPELIPARPGGAQTTHTETGVRWTLASPPKFYDVKFDYFVESNDNPRCIASFDLSGAKSTGVFEPAKTNIRLSGQSAQFGTFVFIGAEHILSGYDHLLFLAVLLLAGGGFWSLFKMVTAFTLAHSVTLALSIMGIFSFPGWFVEPVILISIAVAAAENIRNDEPENRWMIAAVFGLIHGMGFAGFLSDLNIVGENALIPLLGFNVGVELGQAVVVVLLAPLLIWVFNQEWARKFTIVGSAIAALVAVWWLVESFL